MSHFAGHLLTNVIRPSLAALGLPGGIAAEKLVLGTAAKESGGFDALVQVGGGPALSLWQIEPATARDAIARGPRTKFRDFLGWGEGDTETLVLAQLPGNLYLGAALCRLVYYLKPFALPADPSPADLAHIWKEFYNSPQGAGTEAEFLAYWNDLKLSALWETS